MARIVKLLISLVLILATSIGLVYLERQTEFFSVEAHSETFRGYISNEVYDSKEDTAKAFLSYELSGASAQLLYSGYRSLSELTWSDISALASLELTDEAILGGEKVEINYFCNDTAASAKTCFLSTETGYLYYIAPQITGEALTNSYLDTVLDGVKYSNCTADTVINMRIIANENSTNMTYRQLICLADDKAWFCQEFPGLIDDTYFENTENGIEAYLAHPQKNDGALWKLEDIRRDMRREGLMLEVYIVSGGEKVPLQSIENMEDLVDFMFTMDVDASYFVKTDTGFSMTNEKCKEVCKMMAGEEFVAVIEREWEEYHINFRADYYVANGRLSGSRIVMTMTDDEDVFALTITSQYSKFGKTEVTIPYGGSEENEV